MDWRDPVLLPLGIQWSGGTQSFWPHRYPDDWRDSVILAPRYPVDWRDSVFLDPRYPVGWRDSVLLAPRYPVDWRDSVFSSPKYSVKWRDSVRLPSPGTLWTGGTQSL